MSCPILNDFSVAQAFTPGFVRTESGSDRIRKSPQIKTKLKDCIEPGRDDFALFLIRSLPLAVLTDPLNAWARENGALKMWSSQEEAFTSLQWSPRESADKTDPAL